MPTPLTRVSAPAFSPHGRNSSPALSGARPARDPSIPTLEDYIAGCMRKAWRWGQMDCCQFAGGWVLLRTGRNPLAHFNYSSASRARKILAEYGDISAAVEHGMRSVGMSRTEQPEYGDVGLIKTDGAGENAVAGAAVCIFDSRWWVAKELDGISYHDAKPLIAWHVA